MPCLARDLTKGAMPRSVYELGPGRTIFRDGVPLVSLVRCHKPADDGGGFHLTPAEANAQAMHIVSVLNFRSGDPVR
jgi:hypothetical protein